MTRRNPIKKRYIEENFLKKVDRALHANEYEQLKDELNKHRAIKRELTPEIEALNAQYQGVKNSPQAAGIQDNINQKLQQAADANEQLNIYKDLGRKGLGITPEEYKINKAKGQGFKIGGIAGLGTGALGALALQNLGEGKEMTFKNRQLVEEGFGDAWDRTKEAVGNNKGLAATVGGAGLGALYNYASDGAENAADERTQDLLDFRDTEAPGIATAKALGTKDEFTDLRDAKAHLGNHGGSGLTPFTWLGGRTEDLHPFSGNADFEKTVHDYKIANPDASIVDGEPNGYGGLSKAIDSFKLNGHDVSLTSTSDDAFTRHRINVADQFKDLSDAETNAMIANNPELAKQQTDLSQDIGDSKSDSYRNAMLGGAALGAGGTYAARKLKERQD